LYLLQVTTELIDQLSVALEITARLVASVSAAPPQPVADDAAAIDRLAACLGRSVATDVPAARTRS
jgi:hypothetical protein